MFNKKVHHREKLNAVFKNKYYMYFSVVKTLSLHNQIVIIYSLFRFLYYSINFKICSWWLNPIGGRGGGGKPPPLRFLKAALLIFLREPRNLLTFPKKWFYSTWKINLGDFFWKSMSNRGVVGQKPHFNRRENEIEP